MSYLITLRNLEGKDEVYYALDIRFYIKKFGLQLCLPGGGARWCYFEESWYTNMEISMNLESFIRGEFDENGRVRIREDIKQVIQEQEMQYRSHLKTFQKSGKK